ncbi:MAG: YihY/virulence factor BrkB family protein [Thermomicrobiales bacterium]
MVSSFNLEPSEPNSRSKRYRRQRPWVRFRTVSREFIDSFLRIDAQGLSKQISYSVVLALVPAVFVIVAMGTLIENLTNWPVTEELQQFVVERVPEAAQPILLNAIDQAIVNTSVATASISGVVALVIAIWAGMGAVGTLVEAINRAYGVRNTRPFQNKRFFYLVVTLALVGMVITTVMAVFFGDRTIDRVTKSLGDSGFLRASNSIFQVGMIFFTTFLVLLALYKFSPSVDQHLRWSIPGALLSTVAWFALLSISGFVARRINFDTVFGAASGFVLLLYVLNLAALILIIGAVVNGVLGERYDPRRKADLRAHPKKRRYVESGQEVLPDTFRLPVSKSTFNRFRR